MIIECFGVAVVGAYLRCNVPDPPKPTSVVCPPVIAWSPADQGSAADELEKLPPGHPLRKLAAVNVAQRAVVKACQRAKGR